MKLIDKTILIGEIKRLIDCCYKICAGNLDFLQKSYPEDYYSIETYKNILSFIDTLEVINPYEQCIQYSSIKDGIKTYAENYSFNIESKLFNQLTKEQQVLWRKEIEQACITGGEAGVELAKDPRYKKNH